MTGPTREEVRAWKHAACATGDDTELSYLERFAALAFAAGARSGEDARDEWRDALHTFSEDYNQYTEGDAKMPFGTLRVSLAAFLEASAKLDAAMGGNDA